jgi:acetyltransferase-like isoleucine patch superfamily enzyme
MQKFVSKSTANENQELELLGFHGFQQDKSRSTFTKYQDLFVGSRSLLDLMIYEMLTFWLKNLPGMLGFFLRQKLYRFLFNKQGKGVAIATGVSLRQPRKISVGDGCVIDELASFSVRGSSNARIELGNNVFIGRDTILSARDGLIQIHNCSTIGSHCRIGNAKGELQIGKYVLVGAYCYVGAGNHPTDRKDIPMALQGSKSHGKVFIGDDVWIGAHTIVTDGVKIGEGSIIGAGSFVNKNIPAYSIAFGFPAKVYKART